MLREQGKFFFTTEGCKERGPTTGLGTRMRDRDREGWERSEHERGRGIRWANKATTIETKKIIHRLSFTSHQQYTAPKSQLTHMGSPTQSMSPGPNMLLVDSTQEGNTFSHFKTFEAPIEVNYVTYSTSYAVEINPGPPCMRSQSVYFISCSKTDKTTTTRSTSTRCMQTLLLVGVCTPPPQRYGINLWPHGQNKYTDIIHCKYNV